MTLSAQISAAADEHKLVPTWRVNPASTPNNPWTHKRTERFVRLYIDGLSCGEIAAEFGVTRNSAIGKSQRILVHHDGAWKPLCEAYRRKPRGPGPNKRHKSAPRSIALLNRVERVVRGISEKLERPRVPVLDPAPEGTIGLSNIHQLTESNCRWPIGDPLLPEFHYCGQHTFRAPYCAHHHAIAHRKSERKPKGKNGFYWLDLAGHNARRVAA
jgi:GcrA cell cycle regulator